MSEFLGVVTEKGLEKSAASWGGAALTPTVIRVGDGAGAPITPTKYMTDLVRRVGDAYPVIASGRDVANPSMWRFRAVIPAAAGPFDIREIGLFDAAGDMLAIAKHVLVEKRGPEQGVSIELETDILVPFSETAQIVVAIAADAMVALNRHLRAGWLTVDSATLATPPATPATGATYLVPAGATGAWTGLAGQLVQWIAGMWVSAGCPAGHVVADASRSESDPARYLKYVGGAWASAAASGAAYGVTRLATQAEVDAGAAVAAAVTPDLVRAANPVSRAGLARIATAGASSWTCPAGVTVVRVTCVGGGGGGGGNQGHTIGASGGGSGAVARGRLAVTPGTVYAVVVGAGGAGGADSGAGGAPGGETSFGTVMSAGGGPGGLWGGNVGGSAVASGGEENYGSGLPILGGTTLFGGPGGNTPLGYGAGGNGGNPGVQNGHGFGAGGSGYGPSATGAGGAGAPGLVIIEW